MTGPQSFLYLQVHKYAKTQKKNINEHHISPSGLIELLCDCARYHEVLLLKVKEGYRMKFPRRVPQPMRRLIEAKCWSDDPNDRWTMAEIAKNLQWITGTPRPNFEAVC